MYPVLRRKDLYSSYGDLAHRILPKAQRVSFYGAEGRLEWTRTDMPGEKTASERDTLRDIESAGASLIECLSREHGFFEMTKLRTA